LFYLIEKLLPSTLRAIGVLSQMTLKRSRRTSSNEDEEEYDTEVYAGNGEATNANQPIPLQTWSAGNRSYPWIVKRGRGSSGLNTLQSQTRRFSLPSPLPIDEATYRKIRNILARQRNRRYQDTFSERHQHEQALVTKQVEECEKRLKSCQHEEIIAEVKVKHARQALDDIQDEALKARAEFEQKLEHLRQQHEMKLQEKLSILEQRGELIDKQISELEAEIAESALRKKEREAAEALAMQLSEPPNHAKENKIHIGVDNTASSVDSATTSENSEKVGQDNSSDSNEKKRLSSEVKAENLKKVKSAMDDLNQIKSQMIWLLKQVSRNPSKVIFFSFCSCNICAFWSFRSSQLRISENLPTSVNTKIPFLLSLKISLPRIMPK